MLRQDGRQALFEDVKDAVLRATGRKAMRGMALARPSPKATAS